jgi:hypothetical protein
MRLLLALVASTFLASSFAYAQDAGCDAKAAEKKLAGAAKNSFLKKCNSDNASPAQAACDATAAEKKLAGAAKNSFVKKCVAEAK